MTQPFIHHKTPAELDQEAQLKRLGAQTALVDEDETEARIVAKIREAGYSLSKELCLHRKKLIGEVDAQEWADYVACVRRCIAEVEQH